MSSLPTPKTKEQRLEERNSRREFFRISHPYTENKGWQMTYSGGVCVWQLVEGGEFRIFRERVMEALPLELEYREET